MITSVNNIALTFINVNTYIDIFEVFLSTINIFVDNYVGKNLL